MIDSIQTYVLERALSASAVKHQVITNNIANVNTPGYKSKQVNFEQVLQHELSGNTLNLRRTNTGHIAGSNLLNVQTMIYADNNHSVRTDGNNVDIDHESAEMAKNQLYYSAVAQQISRYFNNLKTVINGR